MNIFYINIDEFKKEHTKDFLLQYADRELKTEKRFFEYTIGRYLIKSVGKKIYNIDDEIIIDNKKPVFKNGEVHFSLSHSINYVMACFDKFPVGLDIEYMKDRDLERFNRYYKRNFVDLLDFYKFWTLKEAAYKLNSDKVYSYSKVFEDEYYVTIASGQEILDDVVWKKIF